jgi:hypothetical protein
MAPMKPATTNPSRVTTVPSITSAAMVQQSTSTFGGIMSSKWVWGIGGIIVGMFVVPMFLKKS